MLAIVLVLAPPAQSASARADADDGVQVDPNSPPAAEYALPLDAARRAAEGPSPDGGGGGGGGGHSAGPPPAFGAGISPKPAAAAAAGRNGSRPRDRGTVPARPGAAGEGSAARSGAATTRISDADGEPILYSLGAALAVLAAGGLLALVLRRRQSPA